MNHAGIPCIRASRMQQIIFTFSSNITFGVKYALSLSQTELERHCVQVSLALLLCMLTVDQVCKAREVTFIRMLPRVQDPLSTLVFHFEQVLTTSKLKNVC